MDGKARLAPEAALKPPLRGIAGKRPAAIPPRPAELAIGILAEYGVDELDLITFHFSAPRNHAMQCELCRTGRWTVDSTKTETERVRMARWLE